MLYLGFLLGLGGDYVHLCKKKHGRMMSYMESIENTPCKRHVAVPGKLHYSTIEFIAKQKRF